MSMSKVTKKLTAKAKMDKLKKGLAIAGTVAAVAKVGSAVGNTSSNSGSGNNIHSGSSNSDASRTNKYIRRMARMDILDRLADIITHK